MKRVNIGTDINSKEPVFIDEIARARSTYIIGITGTGKSTILEQIAYQDMVNGDGLIFIDPHEDSAETLLHVVPPHRADDVIFWDVADKAHPFSMHPFWCEDPDEIDSKAGNFLAALESLKDFSLAFQNAPHMRDVLRHLAITFLVNQGRTLIETPAFLTDQSFRREFYPALARYYPWVKTYWEEFDARKPHEQREFAASTLNKLRPFSTSRLMRGIFGTPRNSIDFRCVIDECKIPIVKLSSARLGADNAGFIGALAIWNVLEATLLRADIPQAKRRPFHIIADEFQTYMSTAFPILTEQARKYGVDTTVAHQIREQLDPDLRERVRGVGNLIVGHVTAPNAQALAPEFKIDIPDSPSGHPTPKFEVVRNLLSCLEQRGHENEEVMRGYWALRRSLDVIVETILWDLKWHTRSLGGRAEVTSADYKIVELRRTHFEQFVDRILYRAMTVPSPYLSQEQEGELGLPTMWQHLIPTFEDFYDSLISFHDRVLKIRKAHTLYFDVHERLNQDDLQGLIPYIRYLLIGDTFAEFRDHLSVFEAALKKNKQELPPLLKEIHDCKYSGDINAWSNAYALYHEEGRVFTALRHLIDHLKGKPYYAQVGQPEQILEKSRLYSDVESEIANQLTNLPRFHARCKLETRGGVSNCEITTVKLGVPEDSSLAMQIRQRSWAHYALLPQPFATIENDEEPPDDDDIVFGEKKTP